MASSPMKSVSVPGIREMKSRREKVVMVTAYDFPSARAVDEAGVDIVLVGDSLGMVIQGNEDTLSVTLEQMIYHTSMVSRASKRALVVTDMPFMTYHTGAKDAVRNCGRCLKEGRAQAVKLEGGRKRAKLIRSLVENEIPVMGHVGLTPQSVHHFGGFKVQGKDEASRARIVDDALALEEAGVFSMVLECVPSEVASEITSKVKVPTIGIGSGPSCDGQVLVYHDLLGLSEPPLPRFVKKYADIRETVSSALRSFSLDVRGGKFPTEDQAYHIETRDGRENLK